MLKIRLQESKNSVYTTIRFRITLEIQSKKHSVSYKEKYNADRNC